MLPSHRRTLLRHVLPVLALVAVSGCSSSDADPTAPETALTVLADVDLTRIEGGTHESVASLDETGAIALAGRMVMPNLCHAVSVRASQRGDHVTVVVEARPRSAATAHLAPDGCEWMQGAVPYRIAVEPLSSSTLPRITVAHQTVARDGRITVRWERDLGL